MFGGTEFSQPIDGISESLRILKKGHYVLEQDALFREIGNITYEGLQIHRSPWRQARPRSDEATEFLVEQQVEEAGHQRPQIREEALPFPATFRMRRAESGCRHLSQHGGFSLCS